MKSTSDAHQRTLTRRGLIAAAAAVPTGLRLAHGQSSRPAARGALESVRVAQIGIQGHYGHVQDAIPKVPGCRLVAVARATPDEPIERLRTSPAWSEEVRVHDDYRRMLDEVKPDIVAVFLPYALNGAANIEAARRGCHVISEKPLAGSVEELDRLRQARDKAGVRVTALLPMREDSQFAAARKAVRDGLIGEPVLISAQKSYRWGKERPAFYKLRKTYGGTIPWIGIHAIDFIRSVSGLDYAEVSARQAVKVHTDYPECEDVGALLFLMRNGAPVTLTFDYLRPDKARSHSDDRLRVVGSKGIVEITASEQARCELITDRKPGERLPDLDTGVRIFEDFVESIRSGKPYYLTPEDPFRATEVALKAREAADTRRTVAL